MTATSPLARLIGTWEFEPILPAGSPGHGRATFEWIEDGAFVLETSEAEWSDPAWVEHAPVTSRQVLGWDDTTGEVVALYSDSRGVFRVYLGTLTNDTWEYGRAAPGFHQRFVGAFREDGRRIEGRYDSSPDGSTWELDFEIVYRKLEDR